MPNPRKNKNTSQQQQSAKATASSKASHASSVSPARDDTDESISIAKIHELLWKLSEDQANHLVDIRKDVSETRRAVEAIEVKLDDVLTWRTSEEARLDMLEEEEHIYGFPECVEDKDAISFLRATLPKILQADFQGGLDLDCAHRSLLPPKPGSTQRPFIVRFLRFQQKERVRLAREIGDIHWQNHKISFYQDFSKATQERQHSFLECKCLLHSAKIPFGISYPAVLSFTTPNDINHRFDDPKKALKCIKNL